MKIHKLHKDVVCMERNASMTPVVKKAQKASKKTKVKEQVHEEVSEKQEKENV